MTTPNSPHTPQPYRNDEEMSVIELVKILIMHWKAMLVIFLFIVLVSAGYAWMNRPVVGESRIVYTTLFSVGYKTPTVLIEPLRAVATQLDDAFIPAARQALNTSLNVMVDFNERDTNVVRLKTIVSGTGSEEQLSALHQQALAPLVERHRNILDILAAQQNDPVGMVLPTEARLLVPSEVTSLAQPTKLPDEPSGPSPKIILALGVVLGGILAIMAAFMIHFASLVRASLKQERPN